MGKALSTEDCLAQAREFIERAEATPDKELRNDYLRLAGELTKLAACLDSRTNDGTAAEQQAIAQESAAAVRKRR